MTVSSPSLTAAPPTPSELETIARIIHEAAGIVLSPSKHSMVQSRLAKRLRANGLPDYRSYLALVEAPQGASELREMISALTTNVTQFFREIHHFELLSKSILPGLLAKARAGGKVRIWSAGSSNGQEAYSIAITLAEAAPDLDRLDIKILATDIDPVMIARGQAGSYEPSCLLAVPEEYHKKYFETDGSAVSVVSSLRNLVTFRELNLHHPWPMKGRFDVIFCRNVVIYFDAEAQAALWKRFEQLLSPEGWIFVGHSERIPLGSASRLKTAGVTAYQLAPAQADQGGRTWH